MNNPLKFADPTGRGIIDAGALSKAIQNWWTSGVKRDGGVWNFVKNNVVGLAKGTGSFAVNNVKSGVALSQASSGNVVGATQTVMAPGPQALQPSNKTQADASTGTQVALTVASVAVPAGMAADSAATVSMTTLFRAVLPAEADSIAANAGAFTNPVGIEVKYFSTTLEGAQSYASQASAAFGDGPFTIVQTAIPTSAITPEMAVTVDRGIQTIVVATEDLSKLAPAATVK